MKGLKNLFTSGGSSDRPPVTVNAEGEDTDDDSAEEIEKKEWYENTSNEDFEKATTPLNPQQENLERKYLESPWFEPDTLPCVQEPEPEPEAETPPVSVNLPSATQNLPNMNGMNRGAAEALLRASGFSRIGNTSSNGYQRWRHSDGSEVSIRPDGEVVRLPTTEAAQQFGATGKHNGVRVDAGTGQIVRSGEHHETGTKEFIH